MSKLDELIESVTTDEFEVDFSEAVDFTPIVGKFPVICTEVESGSSAEGNPTIVFKFDVTGGAYDSSDGRGPQPVKGRKLQKSCPKAGKGSGITKSVLKGLGQDVDSVNFKFKRASIVGQQAEAECVISDFNPDFTDIKKLRPLPESTELG